MTELMVPTGHRSTARVVEAFSAVAGAMIAERSLDDVLHLVVDQITRLVGVRRGTIYVGDEESGRFQGRVGQDSRHHATDAAVRRLTMGLAGDRFTREILATRRPLVIAHAETDERLFPYMVKAFRVRSIMGVPMILRGRVIGIFTLDDEDRRHVFTDAERDIASAFAELSAVAVAQSRRTAELRESLAAQAKQNQQLRHAAAIDARLTELVVGGASLRDVAQGITELTGKPCAVHDAEHNLLVSASPPDGEPVVPRLLEPAVREHPPVREALARATGRQSVIVEPAPAVGLLWRCLVAPIVVRELRYGTLVLLEHRGRFSGQDAVVSRRAATVLALGLSAERRAAAAETDARATLLAQLVTGSADPVVATRRAEAVGLDPDSRRHLCLLAPVDAAGTLPDARRVTDVLEANGGRQTVACTVPDGVLVAVSAEGRTATDLLVHALPQLQPAGRIRAVVSSEFTGIRAFARAHDEVRDVVACVARFDGGGAPSVLSAERLGSARFFLRGMNRSDADDLIERVLGPVVTSEHADQLITTAEAWFALTRSIRRTAEWLGVHENTVRNRLERLEQLSGLAVRADADAQVDVRLALLVLRMRGTLGHLPDPWERASTG